MGRTWDSLYGSQRAAELRTALSHRMLGHRNPMFGLRPPHRKGGFRADLGHYVRSSWEADYARVLVYLGQPYEYESRTFVLTRSDGSTLTYTPDFYLPDRDEFIEV